LVALVPSLILHSGNGLVVTVTGTLVVHDKPLASVTVTVSVVLVDGVIVMEGVVAPVLHAKV
jgi:energy-converting hydrogenase Eha subunit H